jgi:hypothetical protein
LWSEIAAISASIVMSSVLLFAFPELREEVRLLAMAGISTFFVIGVTLLTPPEPAEKLVSFYRRVRPPGFWRPVAIKAGEAGDAPLRRLRRYLAATFTAAVSIFILLTGVGRFMIQDIALGRWISASAVLIAAGLLLIPLWWRLGFDERE